MPAVAGEPFRGCGFVETNSASQLQRLQVNTVSTGLSWPTIEDSPNWNGDPGQTLTFRVYVDRSALHGNLANKYRIYCALPGSEVAIGPVITGNIAVNGPEEIGAHTLRLDASPFANNVANALRSGRLELVLELVKDNAGTGETNYVVDSRGRVVSGGLGVGRTLSSYARGYFRSNVNGDTFSPVSNVSAGGTQPSTFAFPDSIFTRYSITAAPWRTLSPTMRLLNVASGIRSTSTSGTGTTFDNSFSSNEAGSSAIVLTDFTASSFGAEVELPSSDTWDTGGDGTGGTSSGDNEWAWGTAFTGFTITGGRTQRRLSFVPVNPAVTVEDVTRTSSLAVVNFGIHSVAGTFRVANARGENITGTNAKVNASSRNSDGTTGKTLGVNLTPTSNAYTLASFTYNGPTTTASRGVGPQNDKAAHSLTGDAKKVGVQLVSPLGSQTNRPSAVSSGSLVALSDLYRIGVHNQRAATFVTPVDPLANPDSTEDPSFTISVHSLKAWAYVADVNGVPAPNVQASFLYFDPDGVKASGSVHTMRTTGADGWTPVGQPVSFDVKAPGGTWKIRAYTDIVGQQGSSQGTNGNYGDGNVNQMDDTYTYRGYLDNEVGFLSPYSADKLLYLGFGKYQGLGQNGLHGNHYSIGDNALVGCALSISDVITIPDAQGAGVFPDRFYAEMGISRFNNATGQAQHFDISTGSWVVDDGTPANRPKFFKIDQSPADSRIFVRVIPTSLLTGMIPGSVFVTARVVYQGAYFQSQTIQPVIDTAGAGAHHITTGQAGDAAFEQSLIFGW